MSHQEWENFMKQKNEFQQLSFILGVVLFILACNGGGLMATATPVPTNTLPAPTSTLTATPKPTSTPMPTATLEPTPAPVGVPVQSNSYEVTVLKVRKLVSGVHTGDGFYWTANPGNIFIELEVKVKNLQPGVAASIPWSHIYVVESDQKAWYPNWGGFKAVKSGANFSASSLSVSSIDNGDVTISFTDDLYLRVIYIVAESDPTRALFGFDDSPMIEVVVKK
jgi:hypothetical protein